MIWVAIGGRGTLIGAALGAIIVNYLKTIFTIGMLAPYWLFVLGAIFVLVTHLPAAAACSACCRGANRGRTLPLAEGSAQRGWGDRRTSKVGVPPTPSPSPQGGGGPVAQTEGRASQPATPQPAE